MSKKPTIWNMEMFGMGKEKPIKINYIERTKSIKKANELIDNGWTLNTVLLDCYESEIYILTRKGH